MFIPNNRLGGFFDPPEPENDLAEKAIRLLAKKIPDLALQVECGAAQDGSGTMFRITGKIRYDDPRNVKLCAGVLLLQKRLEEAEKGGAQ